MAKATVKRIEEITLVLTGEEAAALFEITFHVGGNPKGLRGAIDNIHNELRNSDIQRREGTMTGAVMFPSSI